MPAWYNRRVPSRTLPPLLLPLVCINLFGHIAVSGGRVTTSLFALQSGASELLVGVLIAVYGLLPMLGSLAMGRLVDRIGPVQPMRAGMAAVLVGVVLPAIWPGVPALFANAVLCGCGFNMVSVAAQYSVGHLQQASAAERVRYFGWLALGHSASSVLGPLLVGVLIDAFGHRCAFAALAVGATVGVVLVGREARALEALRLPRREGEPGSVWQLVNEPSLRRIYLVGILLAMSWDLFTFLMPILGHRQNLSASTIGGILALFAAGTFSVRSVMARLARRFSEWRILRAAIVVIVAVYILLPLVSNAAMFFILAYVLGAAVGCSQPNMLSLLHAVAPPGRGAEAVGLRSTFGNASGVFVPFLFGATAASLGMTPLFWGVAMLLAAAIPAAHRGGER
jgi:predicted MFS family arabinose efflux permease